MQTLASPKIMAKNNEKSPFSTTIECNFILKPWVLHQMFFPVAKNSSLCFKLFIKTGVTHNSIYLWVVPKFCPFLGFLRLFHEIQTLFINFYRSQRFQTCCVCISIHIHFIFSKKSNTFMCKLWPNLKSWLNRTKKVNFQ